MKIEDCEVGMKVEPLKEFGEIHKDGLKIHSINKERDLISIRNGCFVSSGHNPKYFKPINKFEVGEKVKWKNLSGYKDDAIIFGIAKQEDDYKDKYAITTFLDDGRTINRVTKEERLFKLKKKDELEPGDKFIDDNNNKVKIIAKEKCDVGDFIVYLGKRESDGYVTAWEEHEVDEIIYE